MIWRNNNVSWLVQYIVCILWHYWLLLCDCWRYICILSRIFHWNLIRSNMISVTSLYNNNLLIIVCIRYNKLHLSILIIYIRRFNYLFRLDDNLFMILSRYWIHLIYLHKLYLIIVLSVLWSLFIIFNILQRCGRNIVNLPSPILLYYHDRRRKDNIIISLRSTTLYLNVTYIFFLIQWVWVTGWSLYICIALSLPIRL